MFAIMIMQFVLSSFLDLLVVSVSLRGVLVAEASMLNTSRPYKLKVQNTIHDGTFFITENIWIKKTVLFKPLNVETV